jgi:cell division protein FtsQ
MPEFQNFNKNKKRADINPPAFGSPERPKLYETKKSPVKPRPERSRPEQSRPSERMKYVASAPQSPVKSPRARFQPRKVRRSYAIYAVLTAVTVMVLAVWLSVTVAFPLNSIKVEGDCVYTLDELMNAGGIEKGVNLIRFDAATAQRNIKNSLVELDSVVVRKNFPSGIIIQVSGAERVLSVYSEGEYLEISRSGRIIAGSTTRPNGLIVTGFTSLDPESDFTWTIGGYLDCADNPESVDSEQIALIFRLVDLIEKHEIPEINRLDLSDRFEVRMFMGEAEQEQVEVKLGAPIQLDEKLAMAAGIISTEIAPGERGVLRISSPRKGTFRPEEN